MGPAKDLIDRYLKGTCTDAERALLLAHFNAFWDQQPNDISPEALSRLDARTWQAINSEIQGIEEGRGIQQVESEEQTLERRHTIMKRMWPYAAAAVAILLTVGTFLFVEIGDSRQQTLDNRLADMEVLPGGNRATLTLADGRVVELSEAQEGIVIGEDGVSYVDGSFVLETRSERQESRYNPTLGGERHIGSLVSGISSLASISTPNGGTYTITLPDGSKVWLNAASTLKYPQRFDSDERVVELEGEAYFEVRRETLDNRQQTRKSQASSVSSPASHLPFKVVSKGQTVEVLGTSFNISAYPEDAETKTTLVSGLVQVALSPIEGGRKGQSAGRGVNNLSASDAPASWRIVPGEQITLTGNRLSKRTVDTELYTAWKSGHFSFSGDLREIFGQIARWYDVTLEYRRDISQNLELDGRLSRHTPLENLLRYVSDASGAFEFEIVTKNGERRLIVK